MALQPRGTGRAASDRRTADRALDDAIGSRCGDDVADSLMASIAYGARPTGKRDWSRPDLVIAEAYDAATLRIYQAGATPRRVTRAARLQGLLPGAGLAALQGLLPEAALAALGDQVGWLAQRRYPGDVQAQDDFAKALLNRAHRLAREPGGLPQ